MPNSHAQIYEDVILWHVLPPILGGFYVDIGAHDPVIDSVSLLFYENGWRGVHVEPIHFYADRLSEARPDELVIRSAIGMQEGLIHFWDIPGTGLSTGHATFAAIHDARDSRKTVPIEVPCMKLSTLFERISQRDIHWLKIDAEGMEGEILESWGSHPARPWILMIEATKPNTIEPNFEEWEQLVFEKDYEFAYADKLNHYYVHRSHPEIAAAFDPDGLADVVKAAEAKRLAS